MDVYWVEKFIGTDRTDPTNINYFNTENLVEGRDFPRRTRKNISWKDRDNA